MFRAAPIVSVKQLAATLLVVGTLVIGACSSLEERAQNHYERGTELLKTDDYAALEFKNAIQLKNSMVPAWLGLAQVAEHDEDWADLAAILWRGEGHSRACRSWSGSSRPGKRKCRCRGRIGSSHAQRCHPGAPSCR